jgi:LysR family glycine cleavage system transcriptional activator
LRVIRHLPPLPALRAFEAACRLNSYSLAARELNITQGAVSQQIRRLEEDLGARLFLRQGARMRPTPEAEVLAIAIRDGLKLIREGLEGFCGEEEPVLVLSVLPSFARMWLGPRLRDVARRMPELTLDIRQDTALANFVTDGIDLAIRIGDGDWPGVEMAHLGAPVMFPVCAPQAMAELLPSGENDLSDAALLEPGDPRWSRWLGGGRRRGAQGLGATLFDDATMVVDAALDGAGVALIRSVLVGRLLKSGRLVRLQKPTSAPVRPLFAVWPRGSRKARLDRRGRGLKRETPAAADRGAGVACA